ncbi:MAG: radical SAM protein [Deltaproteobacteria bacterium]|nr:radical SAM protein [Deltaproteobacteria bacterium]
MLLINPPVVKPSEPPAGIAKLIGCLKDHGMAVRVLDANVEGILHLLHQPKTVSDTWTDRSYRHLQSNRTFLNGWPGYENAARYRRAVADVNRVLETAGKDRAVKISLADYHDPLLSPVKSADLLQAAEKPEANPFYDYFQKRLTALLDEDGPDLIGLSLNYLSQALCTFSMIGFLKKEYPSLSIILGGGLVTSWMQRPDWRNPFSGLVDDMIAGPGEAAILSMLGIQRSDCRTLPDYRLFPLDDYVAPGCILPYSTASGCYWRRCAFCPEKAEGNPYRPSAPQLVAEDIRTLAGQTKPALIHLLDNALSPSVLRTIAKQPPGAPWYGFTRITHHLKELDFCRTLKKSGCTMLKLGIESGDQGVLDALQKGIDLETASGALKSLQEAGIAVYVYLLFGTPPESMAEARRTLDFTVRHADRIGFLNLAIFNMPVCGADHEALRSKPFYEGDLSLYSAFDHPKGWSRGRVRQFLDREFKRHPAVASILKRDPPFFTSNHAPFFT